MADTVFQRKFRQHERVKSGEGAAGAIVNALTCGGLLSLDARLESLDHFDAALLSRLTANPDIRLREDAACSRGHFVGVYYTDSRGRVYLKPSDRLKTKNDSHAARVLGYFCLSEEALRNVLKDAMRAHANEKRFRKEFSEFLEQKNRDGNLVEIIETVIDAVKHVETVFIFIGDETYAVTERFTNLVATRKASGVLDALLHRRFEMWTETEKFLVSGLYILFLSGRSIRFEEFNGAQLRAAHIIALLERLGRSYATPPLPGDRVRSLACRAKSVARGSGSFVGKDHVRYRINCGITFRKNEFVTRINKPDELIESLPNRLVEFARSVGFRTGRRPSNLLDVFPQLAAEVVRIAAEAPGNTLEELIQCIVASAVESTRSDYGMSSSLRDPGGLASERRLQVLRKVLGLTVSDFFCCVVAVKSLEERLGKADLRKYVFSPVQARMQYNRWHFIAGNFGREEIPPDRHYFYPPVLPDITRYSDQHHRGHTRARVKHCIRCPGPDMSEEPLLIGGTGFRGFYDVRVVRTEGAGYSGTEMLRVRFYNSLMGMVWKAIAARVCARPGTTSTIVIRGFQTGNGEVIPTGRL